MRLLVVEDEPRMAQVLHAALACGFTCDVAKTSVLIYAVRTFGQPLHHSCTPILFNARRAMAAGA
jgi:hypothetical protein